MEQIEVRIEGIHRHTFMSLAELEQIREETVKKSKMQGVKEKEQQGKEQQKHKVRGLFDYEEANDAAAAKSATQEGKRRRDLRKTVVGFSVSKVQEEADKAKKALALFA